MRVGGCVWGVAVRAGVGETAGGDAGQDGAVAVRICLETWLDVGFFVGECRVRRRVLR